MIRTLERLRRMPPAELAWRGSAAARTMIDRTRARLTRPVWNREDLAGRLADRGNSDDLRAVRAALSNRRWDEAHRELGRHFARAPRRFVLGASNKEAVIASIRASFPDAARDAAARADRLISGEYDLLGYHGLRFDAGGPPSASTADLAAIDWHLDPVHGRRPPLTFWSTVPYLAPESGDHKIIWELNRHQHWIGLGRAFWLTGNTAYRDRFVAELGSWIEANPPLTGVNWASMLELAFRSISWIWAVHLFADHSPADVSPHRERDERAWLVDLLLALDRQLAQIERNLSYYFSPNTHLLGEALALYVAGRALPELAASQRREKTGRDILLAEIDRQVAADGGHCERSTHYHRYALDFYALALTIARITADDRAIGRFEEALTRLGAAARLLTDDHGRIPHIGDDDGGVLLPMTGRAADDLRDSLAIAAALVGRPEFRIDEPPEEAIWMLGPSPNPQSAIPNPQSTRNPQSAIRIASSALPETGYFVSRSRAGDHLVIDGGPHGYQNAGHAHADALSLTFTVRGVPLLIDPGTGCYTTDPALRDRLRSTALHNTLTLDDRPQSVPKGAFHWSQVANGHVHTWRTDERFDFFDGAHDGYCPNGHRRRVLALHGDLLVVADFVSAPAPGTHTAAVHWHLDPRWTVDANGRRAVLAASDPRLRVGLTIPDGLLEAFVADAGTGLGWHSPVYGRVEATTTLRVSHAGRAPFWMVSVFDLDPSNPVDEVDWVPVWAEAGAVDHAMAIRITRAASIDHVLFAEPADAGRTAEHAEDGSITGAAARRELWRVGEIETDARMLFCRSTAHRPLARLALVNGSTVRVAGRRDLHLALPRILPAFSIDDETTGDGRTGGQGPEIKDQTTCAASPVS